MNDHFFVLMYATSGEERNVTRFASYTNVQDVVDMVNDWLTKCCYMDCYLPGEQEETLKAQNGGKLPMITSCSRGWSRLRRTWRNTTAFMTMRAWGCLTSS